MKIIKSLLIVATALGASTILYAQQQELKTETAKPVAATVPPPGSKPAVAAEVKPVTAPSLLRSENVVVAPPSPSTNDAQAATPVVKPTLKLVDDKAVTTTQSLTPDNIKTLNGTAERPKQTAAPAINEQNAKPLPIAAPAVIKKEGQ